MIRNLLQKRLRLLKRRLKNRQGVILIIIAIAVVCTIFFDTYMHRRLTIDPATYTPLLQVIGKAESNGNYNAYYGNTGNESVSFTNMSIAEVMKWQVSHVQQGSPSSAVGKYQIIDSTLSGLIHRQKASTNQKFDATTQDQLAIALIEHRGAEAYINNEISREQFAHNLAKEWAGLPKVIGENPGDSYYASDGLNKSRVSVDEVLAAIKHIGARN